MAIKNDNANGTEQKLLVVKDLKNQKPELVYAKTVRQHAIRDAIITSAVVLAEVAALATFVFAGVSEDLFHRTSRELTIRMQDELKLDTGVYSGDTDFGYLFGSGEFEFNNGATYEGQWNQNQMEGIGTLKTPSEGVYEGSFLNGQKSGTGTYTWPDGTEYVGEWKEDAMWGDGIYQSADGVTYSGVFKENRFLSGECTFKNPTGDYLITFQNSVSDTAQIAYTDDTTYSGQFLDESLTGVGEMVFPNGDTYNGNFENAKRKGNGTYRWKSGNYYEGQWDDDLISGVGIYSYADGSSVEGTFAANSFVSGNYTVSNDFGAYQFSIENGQAVSVKMSLSNGTTYDGELLEGKLTGVAQIVYSNGDTYSGSVVDGQKNGNGDYSWASGASYNGAWENDLMDGKGTYYYPKNENGVKLTGTFNKGEPEGKCSYYVSDSKYYETDWANGRCVKIYE